MDANSHKLFELSVRALTNEEKIIQEERKYQKALNANRSIGNLFKIRENIAGLERKQHLFNGAIKMRMGIMRG